MAAADGPLAIVLNELADKGDRFTPFLLAHEAWLRGRDVWVVRLDDVSVLPDGTVVAAVAALPARPEGAAPPADPLRDRTAWVAALEDPAQRLPEVDLAAAGLVLLRNTPASQERHGFRGDNPGAVLGRLLAAHGVRVVNRPEALALAGSKIYLTTLPPGTIPATLVTRDLRRARDFVEALPGPAVLKPAVGFGGEEVFLVRPGGRDTLPTVVEVIRRHGWVCVQAFVPEAELGDLRVLLVRGEVPRVDGRPATYRRVHAPGDFRNNVRAGGRAAAPEWGPREEALCRTVGARLRRDGLDLVGIDVAGGKVLDVNVFNPGGLRLMSQVQGVDFAGAVLDALEADWAPGERLNVEPR
jgi:glutathione synthase